MSDDVKYNEDGTIKRTQKGYTTIDRPKHAECLSLKECAYFQPWKVVLKVEPTWEDSVDMDFEPIDYVIYLRAPSPSDAQYTAAGAFTIWEHTRPGIDEDDYPKISDRVHSEAYKLSEQDYMEAWKEAQRYPHVKTGMKENPTIFRFAKPGWNKTGGRAGHGNASIIMPDMEGIKSVQAAKEAMDTKILSNGGK